MASTIAVCLALTCLVLAAGGSYHDERFFDTEDETVDDVANDMGTVSKEQIPGFCWACKRIMRRVKRLLPANATQDQICEKLHHVCNRLPRFIRRTCTKVVSRYLSKLAAELATNDGARAACTKIRLCRRNAFWEME
ncbi:hypothetical protein AGOR_G00102270 [Albula goreensis]|uniref:Saposin B-type domain-containing protein n=1 Tax=Albula goreensis TaxID=1534307 RepID=A0A8T3DC50_9TELE|nr:hypothetical protein AGOR_G00102270 [Albula goreensis]